jgi:hypothetical protein
VDEVSRRQPHTPKLLTPRSAAATLSFGGMVLVMGMVEFKVISSPYRKRYRMQDPAMFHGSGSRVNASTERDQEWKLSGLRPQAVNKKMDVGENSREKISSF